VGERESGGSEKGSMVSSWRRFSSKVILFSGMIEQQAKHGFFFLL
jgi:hypothetical protein